jgi:IS4 transposase
LPETLVFRELRYTIRERGCRTKVITLATTLLDPILYPAEDVTELYGQRWQIESNFRHLKQTLKMDVLRCKPVEGVKKQLNHVRAGVQSRATRDAGGGAPANSPNRPN